MVHQMIEKAGVLLPFDNLRRDLDQGLGQYGMPDSACRDFWWYLTERFTHPAGEALSDRTQGGRNVHRLLSEYGQSKP